MTETTVNPADFANQDIHTLLRAAYSLTHQIDEAETVVREGTKRPGDYVVSIATSRAANRARDLRAARDLIDAEVARRAEHTERVLAAVEKAEQIMRAADVVLGNMTPHQSPLTFNRYWVEAREMLDVGQERMSTVTCSLVKDRSLSDRIADAVRDDVASIKAKAAERAMLVRP